MQLKESQLSAHLAKQLMPYYLVTGDEPFLHQQACNQVRNHAKQNGFTERQIFYVESNFDWSQFSAAFNSLSLFADKKIIELRLIKNTFDKTSINAISHALSTPNLDVCILISMPKISAASKRSTWFKLLDTHGVIVQIWPLDNAQMQHWLKHYASSKQLNINPSAIQYLSEKNQANLRVASQEIEKLSLQFDINTEIGIENLMSVSNQNIYTVFDLSHAFLIRNKKEANLQLLKLKESGEEISFIMWALLRDLRLLAHCATYKEQGLSVQSFLNKQHIPDKQKQLLLNATHTSNPRRINRLFSLSLEIERATKGLSSRDPWLLLERFLLY